MNGLDTNVLVRYITQDDPAQAAAATQLIEESCSAERPGFVALVVLAELCWVLQRSYGYAREQVAAVLATLLTASELSVQARQQAWAALRQFERGNADYADYLIGQAATQAGCATTWTFDRRAAHADTHSLLPAPSKP